MAHEHGSIDRAGFGVLTVSDTRTPGTDESGALAIRLLEARGHAKAAYEVVPDEPSEIASRVSGMLASAEIDFVVVTGGSGIAPRDRTPESVAPLLDRKLPGFGETFRRLSFEQIGARGLLSRALAGVTGGKAVFCLPGSSRAVELALTALVLPMLGHLLWEARRCPHE